MDLNFVSVHKHAKKELGQHPAILTSHLVNNPYIYITYTIWTNSTYSTLETIKEKKEYSYIHYYMYKLQKSWLYPTKYKVK